jgi:hypothetical protein
MPSARSATGKVLSAATGELLPAAPGGVLAAATCWRSVSSDTVTPLMPSARPGVVISISR